MLALLLALTLPAREIVVRPAGPVPTVQAALARARRGDTITVTPGVYRTGNVEVRVPGLLLRGAPGAVLDGGGTDAILIVTADSVTVRGLTFRGVGVTMTRDQAALRFVETAGCRAEGNRIEGGYFGIYLERAHGCVIARNVLRGSGRAETRNGNGIHLWNARDVAIDSNVITGQRDGIYLEFARGVTATGNVSTGNGRYGMHFMFSDDCAYRDNHFEANAAGVAVMYSRRVTLEGNAFVHNRGAAAYGLLLKDIRDSRLAGNTFADNTVGLYAEGASRNVVADNVFRDNGWGVRLLASSEEDRFSGNTFTGNSFDVTTNGLTHTSTFDGNRWDRYQGYDLDHDGVGDVPFRPVRRFAMLVEQHPPVILLLRSPFAGMLDLAESVFPMLTPETLVDRHPAAPGRP